jgi:polysaccharide biosynthesis protein PslG
MKKAKRVILGFCVTLMTFLVFLIPFNAKMAEPDSRFGINTFVLNRYNWEEWDRPVSILKDLKVNWTREEFIWSQIEPQKGNFDWTFYDRAFGKLSESGINVLGIIDYSAPWATEDPSRADADKYMPNIQEWRTYVGKVVDRYGGKVKYWQIWNEPNIPTFFKPEPNTAQYMGLLKNASEVIRNKDGAAKVVLGGLSGVDVGYLQTLKTMDAGRYFDVLAVHPYRLDFKSPPESGGLERDLANIEKIAKEFGGKEVWLTEFGWPTDSAEGVSEDIQAKYLARTYLISLSFSNIKKVFWYDFRDDGNNSNFREDNFGLVERDYTPKKSFLAYKNLINLLEYSEIDKININGVNGIYDFSFNKNGATIRAIWKIDGQDAIDIDSQGKEITIYDILGNKILSDGGNDISQRVRISESPIFIISIEK